MRRHPPRLDFTHPHLLRNEVEYDTAVAEIAALLESNPAPGTPESERLEFLSVLVAVYDETHCPMGQASTPQDVVDFLLDQHGLTRAALAPLFGGRSRRRRRRPGGPTRACASFWHDHASQALASLRLGRAGHPGRPGVDGLVCAEPGGTVGGERTVVAHLCGARRIP